MTDIFRQDAVVPADSCSRELLIQVAGRAPHVHFHTDNTVFSGSEETWCQLLMAYRAGGGHATASWRSSAAFDEAVRHRLGDLNDCYPISLPRDGTLPRAAARWWPSVAALRTVLEDIRPDVLHINNGGWPGALSCLAAARASEGRLPALMVVNNTAFAYTGARRAVAHVERKRGRRLGMMVTASEAAALALRAAVPGATVEAIPNLIREPESPLPDVAEARTALAVAQTGVVALCLARFEERKGHAVLLDAWAAAARPGDILLLGGVGPLKQQVQRRSAELAAQGHDVRLLGHVVDVWQAYAAADVVVLASTAREDMPLTLLEAMRASRAVVATAVAGAADVVLDGETGLLVRPGDAVALAAALRRLLDDADLRRALAASGGRRYREHYSRNASAERYGAVWEKIYARASGAAG